MVAFNEILTILYYIVVTEIANEMINNDNSYL